MNIRELLRSETKASHQQLDSVMGEIKMFESAEGYRNYLKCMQIMHLQTFESVTRIETAADLPRFQPPLLNAIEQDIVSVCGRANGNVQRRPVDLPAVASLLSPSATDWGRAYVVEGSAMGGRYMRRIAVEKLPEECTSRYLESLAWSAEHRWPVFTAAIETLQLDSVRVVEAALDVFESMHQIVNSVLVEDC